jgi:hypothetical protein
MDLERALRAFMRENDLTRSQATRELLRRALGHPVAPIDRGWREGFVHGLRAFKLEQAKLLKRSG